MVGTGDYLDGGGKCNVGTPGAQRCFAQGPQRRQRPTLITSGNLSQVPAVAVLTAVQVQ